MAYLVTIRYLSGLLILGLKVPAVFSQVVGLSPSVAEVLENGNITLTCHYNGTKEQMHSFWTRHITLFSHIHPMISLAGISCTASGYLQDYPEMYAWECLGNSTFGLTLQNVGRDKHGERWTCSQNYVESTAITVFVTVPVDFVEVSPDNGEITLLENSTIKIACTTSYCRPAPNVTWFLHSYPSDKMANKTVISDNSTQISRTNNDSLVSTTSTLTFSPNRSLNGWGVYCTAKNIQQINASTSNSTSLNIIYPPDGPPSIQGFSNGSIYDVIENKHGNLSCSVTGGNPPPKLTWFCYNNGSVTVTTDRMVTNTVIWKASRDQNRSCDCWSEHTTTGSLSVRINVNVLYQPDPPVLSVSSIDVNSSVKIIMENTLSINCTSNSKPPSKYIWTMPDSTTSLGESLRVENINMSHNGVYHCKAENNMISSSGENITGSNTISIAVDVLFPPSVPVFRFENISGHIVNAGSLSVVEYDSFTVTCISTANPEPTLSWNDQIPGSDTLKISTISADLKKTCYAENTMNESRIGTAKAILTMHVLHPPRKPIIKYLNWQHHEKSCKYDRLNVVENVSFSLACDAASRPEPAYSWYGPSTSTSSILQLNNVNRRQKGEYSCHAFNTMERSFGSIERGTNSTSLYVDILYPPAIGRLYNHTVIEGSGFNLSCPVMPGNPKITNIIWTRNKDGKNWRSQILNFPNATRQDSMKYTCTAYNKMEPSCENETEGQDSGNFHFNVVYKASVMMFAVNSNNGTNPVTVNENETLQFVCYTDSNPDPIINILFEGSTLKLQSDGNKRVNAKIKATCLQSGIYTCTGINIYNNGEPSRKHLTLRVKCYPRASPNVPLVDRIYTVENVSVTLSFTALAFPIPKGSGFKWQRQQSSVWIPLTNNEQIRITTLELQSNLTINNVTKSDFGKYRLFIENSVGIGEQHFNIAAKGPPAMPTAVMVKEEDISDTFVTIRWTPGLDYGSDQYFILQYKKTSSKGWTNITVPDTGTSELNYTIVGLSSRTWYLVQIFSSNQLGTSARVEALEFQMKAKPLPPSEIEVVKESLTDKSGIVQWKPGSDGGAVQTFILKYKKLVDLKWINITVLDTGDELMNFTIGDLTSGSKYELFMTSENRIGSSEQSAKVFFQTEDITAEANAERSPNIFVITAPIVASTAFAVLVLVGVIIIWKRHKINRSLKDTHKTITEKEAAAVRGSYFSITGTSEKSFSGAYEDMKELTGKLCDSQTSIYEDIVLRQSTEVVTRTRNDGYEVPLSVSQKNDISNSKDKNGAGADTKEEGNKRYYEDLKKEECIEVKQQTNEINYDELKKRNSITDKTCSTKHTDLTDYMNLKI